MKHVDMVVIGSGPAGQKAAIQAAKLGKQVALIERNPILGGVCTAHGDHPQQGAAGGRAAPVRHRRRRALAPTAEDCARQPVTIEELITRGRQVISTEINVIREHMVRNGVELLLRRGPL